MPVVCRKEFWSINIDERRLSILVFSLFFSWLLAFPFEGQILYALAGRYHIDPHNIIFGSISAHFCGLFICGFLIKNILTAQRLMVFSICYCILGSSIFFFKPSILWNISLISCSFLAGTCVAAWGFFFKNGTLPNQRIKTAASGLIYSNILMIIMNMVAINLSPYLGLSLSILVLGAALYFTTRLPVIIRKGVPPDSSVDTNSISPLKPLAFLCLFIITITINSGLMYQVINPAFAHHEWLVSWYWAVPYIIALYIMKNLPRKTNRAYILYVAIAMIGFAFITFMILDRSIASYIIVDTLMLGACGVYDLFWWSILGEMLDYHKNPAKILGIGLSANVFGVLLGGLIGNIMNASALPNHNIAALALIVVCVSLIILPLLHKHLTTLLKNHAFLTELCEMSPTEQSNTIVRFVLNGKLTDRESEIAALLIKGRTYKMIASELYVSENTVKSHIKNIYSKLNIQSRMELVNLMIDEEISLKQ